MKRVILLLIICTSAVSLFGFGGKEDNKSYDYKGFTAVENRCAVDVEIRTGKNFSIDVKGDPDYIEDLEIELSGRTLEIFHEGGWFFGSSDPKGTTVYISMPEIEGIFLTGSGDLEVIGTVQTDDLELELTGSGSAEFENIVCNEFNFRSRGSGDVFAMSIESDNVSFELNGSGGIETFDKIITNEIEIKIKGSGDIEVKNIKALEAKLSIMGSGKIDFDDVDIKSLSINLAGSGDIRFDNGTIVDLEYKSAASGSFDAKKVIAHKASISLVGSGDVELSVTDNAEVWLSSIGSGDIDIYGNPDVQKNSSLGSGNIKIR